MMKFHPLTVTEVRPEAEDAVTISLEVPSELYEDYRGLPGQHIVVRAEVGGEEARRTYSPVNSPGEWPLRIVARVHPDGRMSSHLARDLKPGDRLEVLPPNGSFTPRSSLSGRRATLVAFAAGSGITPVLAILRSALAAHPENRALLFYGNTSTPRTLCLEDIQALKDRYLDRLAVHFIMSREPQEAQLYNGRIDGSKVRELAAGVFRPEAVTEYFVCGPGDMIEQVSAALRELGVTPERIHGEYFAVAAGAEVRRAPEPALDTPRARVSAADDEAEVTILMDGRRRSFRMQRNLENVLDGAARAGIELPFSCRAGVCSTCRTKVVSGEVEMTQNYALEDWEVAQGYVLACQSHVKSAALELDYDEK